MSAPEHEVVKPTSPASTEIATQCDVSEEGHPCYLKDLPRASTALYDEIVEIVVGPKGKTRTFRAYKGLLTYYVSYFKGAFGGDFIEAHEGKVVLDEDDPEIFQLVFNFINTGCFYDGMDKEIYGRIYLGKDSDEVELCLADELSTDETDGDPTEVPLTFAQLFGLYTFADMRGAPHVLDAALSLILVKIMENMEIPVDQVADVQGRLPDDNSLGCLLGELMAVTAPLVSVSEYAGLLAKPSLLKGTFTFIRDYVDGKKDFADGDKYCVSACYWHKGGKNCINQDDDEDSQ